jgi:mRNA-degrading endonuclease toxin of MazEF toxin-antitoxin module
LIIVRHERKVCLIEALLAGTEIGLPRDLMATAYKIRAISKDRPTRKCGCLESGRLGKDARKATRLYLEQ